MGSLNLINDPWIPVRRKSGARDLIAPWAITDGHDSDAIVALDAARADFKGALAQFLVGLMQTSVALAKDEKIIWGRWLDAPPDPTRLQKLLDPLSRFFEFGGDDARFMQDLDQLSDGKIVGISELLIDTPTGKSLKENKDHFVKRRVGEKMCYPCSATALYLLQSEAPEGGRGNMTSLRGGGPLTTLVCLDPEGSGLQVSLWRNIWLNVLEKEKLVLLTGNNKLLSPEDIFPWLSSTRCGPDKKHTNGGESTYPKDANPLQMYWGLPRRIRLDFDGSDAGACEICGSKGVKLISRYFAKPYGVKYEGAWVHPFTPYYTDSKTGEPMPKHARPWYFTYNNWSALVINDESSRPAVVVDFFNSVRLLDEQLRIWMFGYDMESNKSKCFYEKNVPLYLIPSGESRLRFIKQTENLTEAATQVAYYVQSAVKEAWFKRPGDAKGDTTFLRQEFFDRTEAEFYGLLRESHEAALRNGEELPLRERWLQRLRREAERLFVERAESGALDEGNLARIARAHTNLLKKLNGNKLYEILNLPNPRKEKNKVKETADET